jgi:8-oxo-dGTP pyrophosphatase MutT (NUDIX family)
MVKKNGPWTIHGSTRRFQNEFIEVWEDQVTQPDGSPGAYATVTMKPGVAILPVDNEFVYLTRQYRYAFCGECVEAVAGGIEEGQEPLEAAKRELREELGIEAKRWEEFGLIHSDTSIIRSPLHLFLARDLSFGKPEREGSEVMKMVKMPIREAFDAVLSGEISSAPTCVLLLKLLARSVRAPAPNSRAQPKTGSS